MAPRRRKHEGWRSNKQATGKPLPPKHALGKLIMPADFVSDRKVLQQLAAVDLSSLDPEKFKSRAIKQLITEVRILKDVTFDKGAHERAAFIAAANKWLKRMLKADFGPKEYIELFQWMRSKRV